MDEVFEDFQKLWWGNQTPTLWCEIYAHPLHRLCPVVLNYENLPEPFKKVAMEMEHKGITGDRVKATPGKCFNCENNIRNGGTCDPL